MYDPIEDHTAVYETYRTDAESPYASGYVHGTGSVSSDEFDSYEENLEQFQAEIINREQDTSDETQGLANSPSYIDDDDSADGVEHRDSGIRDIMITGTVRLAFSL